MKIKFVTGLITTAVLGTSLFWMGTIPEKEHPVQSQENIQTTKLPTNTYTLESNIEQKFQQLLMTVQDFGTDINPQERYTVAVAQGVTVVPRFSVSKSIVTLVFLWTLTGILGRYYGR